MVCHVHHLAQHDCLNTADNRGHRPPGSKSWGQDVQAATQGLGGPTSSSMVTSPMEDSASRRGTWKLEPCESYQRFEEDSLTTKLR